MNELIILALRMIERRKLRTTLTMLGIIIGIASIVAILSLGQGLDSAIKEQFNSLGTNKIFIEPKGNLGPGAQTTTSKLTNKDLNSIDKIFGVEETAGFYYGSGKVEFNNVVRFITLFGIPTGNGQKLVESAFNIKTTSGRLLKNNDGKKVVLGSRYQNEDLFGKPLKIRDKILINDEEYKVVGFLNSFGNSADDQSIVINADLIRKNDEWSMIIAKVPDNSEPSIVSERIEKNLRKLRGVDEGKEDFTVRTAEEFLDTYSGVLNVIKFFLIGIASISLIVGGIGILNSMYTSVLERTQEIGVMKAIGATNKDIIFLFLFESGILGLVGGGMGVLIGLSFAKLTELIIGQTGNTIIQANISIVLIISMLLFSFIFGTIAGVLPAIRASKLKPTEALRYE